MSELLGCTLIELTEKLGRREVSPVELMQTVLREVSVTHEELNALVVRRGEDELLAEAKQAQERIAKGEARPLEGIPLGVKDLENAAGLPNSQGSLLFKDHVPERDSTQVSRLRAAGAIVIGKTNAPEFGTTAITKNLLHGVTRSPWDLERTPGGSSGGSSALISGEIVPLCTSSDGGGSIRIPASFVGAFGLKPSMGRVPRGPFDSWDMGKTSVYGPLQKTVEDAALVLDLTVGHDPRDPVSLPHPGYSYLEKVRAPLKDKLKIAYSPDLGYAVVQSDVAAAVEEGVRQLEALGHRVTRIDGGPPELGGEWGLIGAFELGSKIARQLESDEENLTRGILRTIRMAETGLDLEWWGVSNRRRAELVEWCAALFDRYDILVTPTVPYDPPPAGGPFPPETEGQRQRVASVASFTIPFNLSWNPASTVRVGLSKAGLPIGMQLVGPLQRDDLVLQLSRQYERAHPWHPHWPRRKG